MGTTKYKLQLYLDRELVEDFHLLYMLWEIKCKRRGISSSKSRFMDSILREYVNREKELFIAEAKKKYAAGGEL